MSKKVILSADSTCDLGDKLKSEYNVNYCPFIVSLENKDYHDLVDIFPDDIYHLYSEKKILPKTAAIGVGEYVKYFKPWVEQGYEVIHINLSSAMSSSYQNCCMAAKELGNIYPIDSKNLSTGMGLLVLEAGKRIKMGIAAKDIKEEILCLTDKVHSSFIVDNLEFLKVGGRCSSIVALGANLLKLKPCIEVNNLVGKMSVGKKYRGDLKKVLEKYTEDALSIDNVDTEKIFITHSGISEELINIVYNTISKQYKFKNIYITRAGCTISSHCGPNTIGVLFLNK